MYEMVRIRLHIVLETVEVAARVCLTWAAMQNGRRVRLSFVKINHCIERGQRKYPAMRYVIDQTL